MVEQCLNVVCRLRALIFLLTRRARARHRGSIQVTPATLVRRHLGGSLLLNATIFVASTKQVRMLGLFTRY